MVSLKYFVLEMRKFFEKLVKQFWSRKFKTQWMKTVKTFLPTFFLVTSITHWPNPFTGLLFHVYVGSHQVWILVFDNYQRDTLGLYCVWIYSFYDLYLTYFSVVDCFVFYVVLRFNRALFTRKMACYKCLYYCFVFMLREQWKQLTWPWTTHQERRIWNQLHPPC